MYVHVFIGHREILKNSPFGQSQKYNRNKWFNFYIMAFSTRIHKLPRPIPKRHTNGQRQCDYHEVAEQEIWRIFFVIFFLVFPHFLSSSHFSYLFFPFALFFSFFPLFLFLSLFFSTQMSFIFGSVFANNL